MQRPCCQVTSKGSCLQAWAALSLGHRSFFCRGEQSKPRCRTGHRAENTWLCLFGLNRILRQPLCQSSWNTAEEEVGRKRWRIGRAPWMSVQGMPIAPMNSQLLWRPGQDQASQNSSTDGRGCPDSPALTVKGDPLCPEGPLTGCSRE